MPRNKNPQSHPKKYDVQEGRIVTTTENEDHADKSIKAESQKKLNNQGFCPLSKASEKRVSRAVESAHK